MWKLAGGIAALLLLAAAYVASPFHAAWSIREAMKSGDSRTLDERVQWPSVRETLRASLAEFADPAPSEIQQAGSAPKKGLWARFKSFAARKAVDRLVDSYGNAEGLPQLFTYGASYRAVMHGPPPPKTLSNLPERVQEFWSRVRRAEFKSATVFELEMQDKHTPDRHYTGLLELNHTTWKLTELRVHKAPASPSPTVIAGN